MIRARRRSNEQQSLVGNSPPGNHDMDTSLMAKNQLQRILGRGFSMAACVGSIIGLGILRTPGEIVKVVSDPWLYLGWWFGGGLFVLMTLLFVGELMSMTRKSGGVYSLISRAFGRFPSFVIGWIDWVSFSATMALKAVVAAEYLAILLPSLAPHVTVLALFITSAFATLQLAGTRVSASIQETASAGIGLVIAILACALFYGAMASTGPIEVASASGSVESLGIMAFGLVAASIIFTYDGWAGPSYFCGEVRSGGRGVVKGSIQGFLVVMVLYMLLNVALVLSVPLTSIGGNDLAMAKALNLLFGSSVETVLIVAAVFILLAHQNLNYMMTSRIIYALSQDGLGSEKATVVADNGAPVGAVILSWILVCILIAVGSFEFLLKLTVSLLLIAYVAMVLGVFRLRRSEPNAERPFVAWGYPFTGVVCAIGWSAVAVLISVGSVSSTLFGLAAIIVAIPVYYLLRKWRHLDELSESH
jgi:APA family basic amino acid/polyamine antiporter